MQFEVKHKPHTKDPKLVSKGVRQPGGKVINPVHTSFSAAAAATAVADAIVAVPCFPFAKLIVRRGPANRDHYLMRTNERGLIKGEPPSKRTTTNQPSALLG